MPRPSDFPCNVRAVACGGYGDNHLVHHLPLIVKGYAVPSVQVAGKADLFRTDGFHCQLRYLLYLRAPVPFGYLHIWSRTTFALVRLTTSFSTALLRLIDFQYLHHLLIDYRFQFGVKSYCTRHRFCYPAAMCNVDTACLPG